MTSISRKVFVAAVAVLTVVSLLLVSLSSPVSSEGEWAPLERGTSGFKDVTSDSTIYELKEGSGTEYNLVNQKTKLTPVGTSFDMNVTITIPEGSMYCLDLNGCTLTATENVRMFDVRGSLIIQDSAHPSGGAGSLIGKGSAITADESTNDNGGCMYIYGGGNVSIYDVTIKNFVAVDGGAIYTEANSKLYIEGAVIGDVNAETVLNYNSTSSTTSFQNAMGTQYCGNVATGASYKGGLGGAISIGGTFKMGGGKICGNETVILNNEKGTPASYTGGGALYVASGATATILAGELSNNIGNLGGAIYSNGGLIIYGSEENSIVFRDNVANQFSQGSCGNGGAIYLRGGSGSTISFKNTLFDSNISGRFGGAIEIEEVSVSKISFYHCSFIDNRSVTQDCGGLIIDSSKLAVLELLSCKFERNVSGYTSNLNGGALYLYSGDLSIDLTGTEMSGNSAKSGAAIYVGVGDSSVDNKLIVSGGGIHNNTASENGGGIYVASAMSMDSCDIHDNTASGNGGGMYVGGTLTMASGTVQGNSAKYGGGAYITQNFTMTGGSIINNMLTEVTSEERGRDVFVVDTGSNKVSITGGQISYVVSILKYIDGDSFSIYDKGSVHSVLIANASGATVAVEAKDGNYTPYWSLASAISGAVLGETIVLLDGSHTGTYSLKDGVTLDLNGKEVACTVDRGNGIVTDSSYSGIGSLKGYSGDSMAGIKVVQDSESGPYRFYPEMTAKLTLKSDKGEVADVVDSNWYYCDRNSMVSSQTLPVGKTCTVGDNVYYLNGWTLVENGSTVDYVSSLDLSMGDDITLYAVWERAIVEYITLTFVAGTGAQVDVVSKVLVKGEVATFDVTATPLVGYTASETTWSIADGASEWATQKVSGAVSILSIDIGVEDGVASDYTFMANMTPSSYTVTFDPNGGTLDKGNPSVSYGDSVNLSDYTPAAPSGIVMQLMGWKVKVSEDRYMYYPVNGTVTIYGATTITAVWSTVTYQINGVTVYAEGLENGHLKCIDSFAPTLIPSGKVFIGWSSSEGGSVSIYDCGVASAGTFYAVLVDLGCNATWVPSSAPEVS